MAKKESRRERSIRNKAEYAEKKKSGRKQLREKKAEASFVGKVPVPKKDDVVFWDDFFSRIESGETLHGFAVEHGMTDQVLRDRLRRGELHERFIEAHQGRAVYHAQSIEGMIDRLESGDVESDVARRCRALRAIGLPANREKSRAGRGRHDRGARPGRPQDGQGLERRLRLR